MDLLDRYLHAIEFWLPKSQRQDIIAELSEDLRSQIDDKENELGRKLTIPEVEAILKRCGSPLMVAFRYRPQHYLIGPTLFPIYRFTLGVLLLGCIVPRFLVWLGFLIADPAHRGYLHMENLWTTVVFFGFFTTLVFAIIERTGIKFAPLDCWNPSKLPPRRDPNRISRSGPLAEIALTIIFNIWFISVFFPRPELDLFTARITLAPAWRFFFWGFMLLAVFNLVTACMTLIRPYWTPVRATVRLVSDTCGAGLFCGLLKAQVISGISMPGLPASKAIELTGMIHLWMTKLLPWSIVVMLVIVAIDIYRILRVRRAHLNDGPPAPGVKNLASPVSPVQ